MIFITIVSGPHAGKTREISEDMNVPSHELLVQLWQMSSVWEIDFSRATPAEMLAWGRADLGVRCIRALFAGLTVSFLGELYKASIQEDASAMVAKVEDVIVQSGHFVGIEYDDERGVCIGVAGPRIH